MKNAEDFVYKYRGLKKISKTKTTFLKYKSSKIHCDAD